MNEKIEELLESDEIREALAAGRIKVEIHDDEGECDCQVTITPVPSTREVTVDLALAEERLGRVREDLSEAQEAIDGWEAENKSLRNKLDIAISKSNTTTETIIEKHHHHHHRCWGSLILAAVVLAKILLDYGSTAVDLIRAHGGW